MLLQRLETLVFNCKCAIYVFIAFLNFQLIIFSVFLMVKAMVLKTFCSYIIKCSYFSTIAFSLCSAYTEPFPMNPISAELSADEDHGRTSEEEEGVAEQSYDRQVR